MILNVNSVTNIHTVCRVLLKRGQRVSGAKFKIILNVIKESKVSKISHHTPTSYETKLLCSTQTPRNLG